MLKKEGLYEKDIVIQQKMNLDELEGNKINFEMRINNFNERPYLKGLYQIKLLMRDRYKSINENIAINILETCYNIGISIDGLRDMVLDCNTWDEWLLKCNEFIEEYNLKDSDDKIRAILNDKDIRELTLKLEKEIENILDELSEIGFIRYKETEKELVSVDISTREGKIKADRLLNNLNIIDEIFKEISCMSVRVKINVKNGKVVPEVMC